MRRSLPQGCTRALPRVKELDEGVEAVLFGRDDESTQADPGKGPARKLLSVRAIQRGLHARLRFPRE